MKKRARVGCLSLALSCFFFSPASSFCQEAHPARIVLRGYDGTPLSPESRLPYSPKKTCGSCHDYDRITNGYHFQQGRTDSVGRVTISDVFDPKYSWNLSGGMYGKLSLVSPDPGQLAKKVNTTPSEIDKSAFHFVQSCGVCHPGGGWGENDRKGNLYYNSDTQKLGSSLSEANPVLDGDYTPYSGGEIGYGAPWDESGVSEADCLICHLKGYQWKERAAALQGRHFMFGPAAGAGWAFFKTASAGAPDSKADQVTVDYSKKELADFENLNQKILRKPPDENCWACHATPDGKQRGQQWSSETDVHKAKGLTCLSCHPSDRNHNFAKGNSIQQTVRDDLDNTMPSCEDCHYKGRDKRAPRFKHPFSPRHMKRIACQTCHIPICPAPADLVYDLASSGSTVLYDTSRFLSQSPGDPRRPLPPGESAGGWYPSIRDYNGRLVPTKPLVVVYWGDLDEKSNVVRPLLLWKIRELKKLALRDDNGDGILEVNSLEEIKLFLQALKTNDKFGNPLANQPALIKGGFLYRLDKKGEVEKTKHEQADLLDYSLSHNVVSGASVLGSRGCQDCHTRNSPFFLRKVLLDPFDERGRAVYVETWERLGFDREKLERLLLEQ